MSDDEAKNDQKETPAPEPEREPAPAPERPFTERRDIDAEGERVIKLEPEDSHAHLRREGKSLQRTFVKHKFRLALGARFHRLYDAPNPLKTPVHGPL